MENQAKQTAGNQNLINNLGDHAIKGGPGRPKGSKNKFTRIKEELVEIWHAEKGKERFRELFHGSQADFLKALDRIIAILPKEPPTPPSQQENLHFTYSWASDAPSKEVSQTD